MKYSNGISKKVEDSKVILTEMITNAQKQGAQNFDMLYVLQDALEELYLKIGNKEKIDIPLLKKWDNIMGWVPKVFEGHPLLDLIREIDKVIMDR